MYVIDHPLTVAPAWLGAVPAPPGPPPKGLILLPHFQSVRRPAPGAPGTFTTGPLTPMAVSDLNPGFIDAADALVTDTGASGLQTCLQRLVTTRFRHYLGGRTNTAPAAGDRLRVALVDLTGDKLTRPEFAGWGSTAAMYAASVAKILAVYAAHQLRTDLRHLAATQAISSGPALEKAALALWRLKSGAPNLAWLFDLRTWSSDNPATLEFSEPARHALAGIMHNADAAAVIVGVGFPYIASVTWQSGLFHPTRGGLWLSSSYGGTAWAGNPIAGVNTANVTALSAATYLTLMAQGRLVTPAASSDIKGVLRGGCITGLFPQRLGPVASKCGIWSDFLHDCALVERGGLRYVVAGLTRTRQPEFAAYTDLFLELDNLIARNNQVPRPSC